MLEKQHKHGHLIELPDLRLGFLKNIYFMFCFSILKAEIDFTPLDCKGFVWGLKVVKHTCVVSFHLLPVCRRPLLGLNPRVASVLI